MKRNVGRAKKKFKVFPKARKAFQVKYDGQPLPLEFITATREKYEKFIVSNNLLESSEEEYLETLEKKFKSSKEVDAKSKDGHMVLKWAAFNSVDKMFFFGDDLLCLVNGSYIQVVECLDSIPKQKTWNLFNAHSAAELIEGRKSCRSFTIQVVAGCPYMPTLAYVISNSPVIRVMTYPQMSLMAELRSSNENGDFIDLKIGIGECLYGLRGQPGNVVEIWSLRSRSILASIPGSFYSNETIMRLSPTSYNMLLIDQGCQDVVRWTLHRTSPLDLLAYPQAVSLTLEFDFKIVDASFTYEDELYLLTERGDIYCVDGNNEIESCRLIQNSQNSSRFIDKDLDDASENSGWSSLVCHYGSIMMVNNTLGILKHFTFIRKTYLELVDVISIGEAPKVAFNSLASIFKTGSLLQDNTLVALMNVNGLKMSKWNVMKLSSFDSFIGLINDITVLRNYAIVVESRRICVIGLEDGATACTIPVPLRVTIVSVHPSREVVVVSVEAEGSFYVFKMSGATIEFLDRFQSFTSPLDLMLFSIRGDFFVVRSRTNEIGLFKVYNEACFGILTAKSVDHDISSMTFINYNGNQYMLAVLGNPTDGDYSVIYVYDIPGLLNVTYIELPEKLFQVAECVGDGKYFGTTYSGLSVSTYCISLGNDGEGLLKETKTLKTYEDVCRRRMTANRNYLMVFGTEGCLDIFAQNDENQRVFSVTHNLFAFSGYVNAAVCPELKYVVGVHASGVVTCRSIKHRIKPKSEDENSIWSLDKIDSTQGVSETEKPTYFCHTKNQKEEERKNEIRAIMFVHQRLIEEFCVLLHEISAVEDLIDSLDQIFQEELSLEFSEVVSSMNLMAVKYRNLRELNRRSSESVVSTTQEGLEALNLYARRYRYLFEDDSGKGAINGKNFSPSIIKGVVEHSYNFYKSSACAIEGESADGILVYCSDLVTVSNGFDKYITPRWLRNSGPAAELSSLTIHARKRGVDEYADRPKMDLNKKISEAVKNFTVYFINKRKIRVDQSSRAVVDEEDKKNDDVLPLIKLGNGLGEETEFLTKKDIGDVGRLAVPEAALAVSSKDSSGEGSSDEDCIPEASNDGTEEERLSSDSFSSGSTFSLPNDEEDLPGSRSTYLIRLLERKEARKTRKFELKDGMLKCYHHFNENVRAFIKKFHGSSSHEFLHIFPLCFCPDETDSVFNNDVQFSYSRYFVEALREHFNSKFEEIYLMKNESVNNDAREIQDTDSAHGESVNRELQDCEGCSGRFMIEPLKPFTPLMMPLEPAEPCNFGDGVPLNKIEICPAVWKESDKLISLIEWMKLAMIPACDNCQKQV